MKVNELTLEKNIPEMNTMETDKAVLSVRGMKKAFGGQVVLDDISLDLRQGEVVLLRGENGSGKTTLVNILTGNLEPDRGELCININGNNEEFAWPRKWWKNINPFDHFTPERLAREGIGRAWQDIRLFPTMTALENVAVATQKQTGENPALALLNLRAKREDKLNRQKASEWLGRVGLGDRLDSSCDKISLGQMKRVAIARAIQAGAKVLFLDEPLSGLDRQGISEVMGYLETLARENSITLVIVEHVFNIPTVLSLADTVWTLSNGKLSVIKADELVSGNNDERNDIYNLISHIAKDNARIKTEELSNGARITTAVPVESNDPPDVLEVKDLAVKRGIRTVLNGLSFGLKKGQLTILEAPNGWGKSTLLDAISGVCSIESGKIILNGKDISTIPTHKRIKRGLAYLRSQESPFTSLNVAEHKKLAKTNNNLFNSLNSKKTSYLSGGEKQKLLIEMLPEADIYLLDEPMIGLDREAIEKMMENIGKIAEEGKSILITMPERIKGDNLS